MTTARRSRKRPHTSGAPRATAPAADAGNGETGPDDLHGGALPPDPAAEHPLGELLLAQAHVPAFRAALSGDCLRVNEAFARLLGYESPRDLEGATLRNRIVEDADWSALTRSLRSGGGVAGQSLTLCRRDGARLPVAVDATAVLDARRGEHDVYGLVVEMAPELPFTPGLHDRERWFRAISNFGTHIVIVTELDGRVRYANPAAELAAGVGLEAGRGRPVTDFLHPDDRAPAMRRLREAIAAPGTHPSIEVRLAATPAGERIVHATGIYLPDFPGGASLLLYGRDVTAQHALQREYLHAQKLEAVALLAAGLAHDFNNLLTAILGHAQLLARGIAPGDPERHSCDEIAGAAGRGGMLTRQLLSLGQGQVVQPRPIRVGHIVRRLAATMERLLPENVRFRVELHDGTPQVEADPGAIEQVLLNLLVNARDAIEGNGSITVRVAPARLAGAELPPGLAAGAYVEMSVTDDGAGIDPAVRDRIFEPFFTTKEPGRGSGLGLSSAHGLVRRCGGAIAVDSTPGNGSSFRVLLPALPSSDAPAPATPEPPAGLPAAPATVLFVEDDPMILEVTSESLTRRGHRVWTASDAAGALSLAARLGATPPAVLVSDIVLPDEDGVTLARRLLERWPDLRVVLTSGYSNHGARVAGLVAEGHEFLEKPYHMDHLSRAIGDAMRRTERA